jgi:hypothetical protein
MLTREDFKEQLEKDPNREYFDIIIWDYVDSYPVKLPWTNKMKRIPEVKIVIDKITEAYFSMYKIHGKKAKSFGGMLTVEKIK